MQEDRAPYKQRADQRADQRASRRARPTPNRREPNTRLLLLLLLRRWHCGRRRRRRRRRRGERGRGQAVRRGCGPPLALYGERRVEARAW